MLPALRVRSVVRSTWIAAVLVSLLMVVAASASAQGLAGGRFAIDGQFYSAAGTVDWAQGPAGEWVFDAAGNSVLMPSLYVRDAHWAGNASDPTAFAGNNKNDDLIGLGQSPWKYASGNGPSKNDLTDVYAYSEMIDGDIWLFLGAATRATNGSSHIDFEFNQQGFTESGGMIIGNGGEGGRTAGIDFIVSVDFESGGAQPVPSFRTWENLGGGTYGFLEATPDTDDVYVCTNLTDVPAPPWGAIDSGGDPTDTQAALQLVEIGLNLTDLGIDPSVFCTDVSTLLFKTRSATSFSAELKDLVLEQFSIVMPPACDITAVTNAICDGESVLLCAPEAPVDANYTYVWTGPGGPYPNERCITVSEPGTYGVTVTDLTTGCAGEGCTFELAVDDLPVCGITADTEVVCAGESAEFCGPEAPEGHVYSYAWDGPGGPFPDARCISVEVAGEYGLVVTDVTTGCVADRCALTLTVNPLPPTTISAPDAVCADTTATLCAPEGNYTYSWDGPGGPYPTERCITVDEAGDYTVTVTDIGTGCTATSEPHPLAINNMATCGIEGPETICPSGEEELCGPEGEDWTYVWSGPGGFDETGRCVTVTEPGTYWLEVTTGDGCVSMCSTTLTLDENVTVSALEDLDLCTGEQAELCVQASGTGPITYQWYFEGTLLENETDNCLAIDDFDASRAGEYTVTVSGKCNRVSRSADLRVADVRVADLRGGYLCEGQTIELCAEPGGLGPFRYTWTRDGVVLPDQTGRCLVIEDAGQDDEGVYCVTVAGACGNPVQTCAEVLVGTCELYCGLTQGFYGNRGGKFNGERTLELLDRLITPGDPLVMGVLGKRSFSIEEGSEPCIIDLLPGGSTARTLPEGLGDVVVDPVTCWTEPPFQATPGRIRNILLSQGITLTLNTRLDPNLVNLPLCETIIVIDVDPGKDKIYGTDDDVPLNDQPRFGHIPTSVLEALDAADLPRNVGGLVELVNLALADCLPEGADVTVSEVGGAAGAINDLVDECVLFIHCEGEESDFVATGEPGGAHPRIDDSRGLDLEGHGAHVLRFALGAAVPNPLPSAAGGRIRFSLPEASQVSLHLFDVRGRRVNALVDGTRSAGQHDIELRGGDGRSLATGVYFLRMDARGLETGAGFSQSRKIVVVP